jgi:hypothetical protein
MAGNKETYLGLHAMCPIVLPDFKQIWNILTDSPQYHISQKSVGSCTDTCGQTDKRTDMTKVISVFRDYVNFPEIIIYELLSQKFPLTPYIVGRNFPIT